jgi:hypothetical protein
MFFANAFVLLMDEGKRIIPGDTDEFILSANALRAVRRCQKAFTDHRKRTRVLLWTWSRTTVCSELGWFVGSAPRDDSTVSPSVSTNIGPQWAAVRTVLTAEFAKARS